MEPAAPLEEGAPPRRARQAPDGPGAGWLRLGAVALAAVTAIPLAVIVAAWVTPETEVWRHLAATVLPELLRNTFTLLAGVGVGVLLLGCGLAWLTARCEFPGQSWLDWALMLPLAVPAYVLAFVVQGQLDAAGPLQTALRGWLGPAAPRFEVRGAAWVTVVLVLAFYPYVYLLARSAFLSLGRGSLEAARLLGLGPWEAFLRVALPAARPAIVAGVALALMETLADFGAVSVFNYDTFTTAIYKAWFGLFSLPAAAQLASLLMLIVALALLGERRLRGRSRFHEGSRSAPPARIRLAGWRGRLAAAAAMTVVLVAFGLPMGQLVWWAAHSAATELDLRYWELVARTLLLGSSAALVTVAAAMTVALARRHLPGRTVRLAGDVSALGYALPGSVLAVGIMLTLTAVDNVLTTVQQATVGGAPGPWLSGTLVALLLAYLARFMAVALGPVGSALERLRPSLTEAARSLGARGADLVRRVYFPLLRPGILTGALLVMVEVMKEMPATLLLRPFGWETLAVRIFEFTSEGDWQRAALPAVTLVVAGLLPVIWLVRRSAAVPRHGDGLH
jgi:iron(III) transport system permease protein